MSKDSNYTIKVEQAIAKKYGEYTVQHRKNNWDNKKEKEYLSQIKEFYTISEQTLNEVEVEGVLISKKLITKESNRSCPVCNTYSFKSNDDVYMSKFECCEKCYIQWVEDREERWLEGWRPNDENNKR